MQITPCVSRVSLIVIGTPCSGFAASPRASAASAAAASRRADSAVSWTTALSFGLTAWIRAKCASTTSALLRRPARMAAARSAADAEVIASVAARAGEAAIGRAARRKAAEQRPAVDRPVILHAYPPSGCNLERHLPCRNEWRMHWPACQQTPRAASAAARRSRPVRTTRRGAASPTGRGRSTGGPSRPASIALLHLRERRGEAAGDAGALVRSGVAGDDGLLPARDQRQALQAVLVVLDWSRAWSRAD